MFITRRGGSSSSSGGVTGSGTNGKIAKWKSATELEDSILTQSVPARVKSSGALEATTELKGATLLTTGDGVISGGLNVGGSLSGGLSVCAPAVIPSAGVVYIGPQDNALEGGQVTLEGGGNGGTPYDTWTFDNWTAVLRWFTGGVVKMTLTTAGVLGVIASVSAGTLFALNGLTALSFNGTACRLALDATWTTIEFYAGGTLRWLIDATSFKPNVDNTYDVGTAALRVRDVYVAGELVGGNEVLQKTADQATFVNAQTNISGLSFPIGPNEVWVCDFVVPVTMGTAATGVKFYFTFPVGCTGEIQYEGNIATILTWQSLYQAALTVPGTFFVTGIITGVVRLRVTVRNAGTGGTIQLVGITGGATTTCAVKKGASMIARRFS